MDINQAHQELGKIAGGAYYTVAEIRRGGDFEHNETPRPNFEAYVEGYGFQYGDSFEHAIQNMAVVVSGSKSTHITGATYTEALNRVREDLEIGWPLTTSLTHRAHQFSLSEEDLQQHWEKSA